MENEFGSRIKQIRLSCRENQIEFAQRFKKTQATVSRWEAGKQEPEHEDLFALSKLGNMSLEWLVNGEGAVYETPPHLEVSVFTYAELENPHIVIEDFTSDDRSDRVLCPADLYSNRTLALRIKGEVMRPVREGWLLYFSREQEGVDESALGKLCVVKRSDADEILVRELLKGHSAG